MRSRRASDILPDELLRELQKYVSGETIYVPKAGERREWGSGSGALSFYRQRNAEIRRQYVHGISIDALAEQYGLSPETIRKIVYR